MKAEDGGPTLTGDGASGEELFDPYHLGPLASLNSRKVASIPGIPEEVAGRTGFQLFSKHALIELIEPHVQELGFESDVPAEYPQRLNALLEQPVHSGYTRAVSIAEVLGRRFGYYLASMVITPVPISDPVTSWEAAYLNHWQARARHVAVGGGLTNGRLGEAIVRAAQNELAECGVDFMHLRTVANPAYLPLIGAARSARIVEPAAVLVADFGSSRAKRGIAFFDRSGRLERIRIMPPRDVFNLTRSEKIEQLAQRMVSILVETAREAGEEKLSPHIIVSVAAYVQEGKPLAIDRGAYYSINRVSDDLRGWFAEQILKASGVASSWERGAPLDVEFVHDCDSAACALAGSARLGNRDPGQQVDGSNGAEPALIHAAPLDMVIMLGTSAGAGFIPPATELRPLADGFRLELCNLRDGS